MNFDFATISEKTLLEIFNKIDAASNLIELDAEYNDGIITISSEKGTYVINKHSASKQIWLSSPITGPYRFSYINGNWTSATQVLLLDILSSELAITLDLNYNITS